MRVKIKDLKDMTNVIKRKYGWNSTMDSLCGTTVYEPTIGSDNKLYYAGWEWPEESYYMFVEDLLKLVTEQIILKEHEIESLQKAVDDNSSKIK